MATTQYRASREEEKRRREKEKSSQQKKQETFNESHKHLHPPRCRSASGEWLNMVHGDGVVLQS